MHKLGESTDILVAGSSLFDNVQRPLTPEALVKLPTLSWFGSGSEIQGDVRISCPLTLSQVWLAPLLPGFMLMHRKVRLHVTATNHRVDPVEDRMDLVIRVRRPPASSGASRMVNAASNSSICRNLVADDMFALRDAALRGVGIALLPRRICRAELRAGRLEQVLPTWTAPPAHVQAVFTSRRGMAPAVRALLDYLKQHPQDDLQA